MPDQVQEVLKVKVAHFDPVTVSLVGQGVYPALSLTLPRVRNEEYDQAVIEAQDALRAAQLKPQQAPRYDAAAVACPCASLHVYFVCIFPIQQEACLFGKTWPQLRLARQKDWECLSHGFCSETGAASLVNS